VAYQAIGYMITLFNDSTDPRSTQIVTDLVHYRALVQSSGSVCLPLGFSSCKELVCNGMLHGVTVGLNISSLATPTASYVSLQTVNGQSQRSALHVAIDTIQELLVNRYTALLVGDKPNGGTLSHMRSLLAQLPPSVTNKYPLGNTPTFDAYGAGCESQLSKYACQVEEPSSSGRSSAWLVGVTLGPILGVGVLFAAVFIAVREKNRSRHRNLQDHEEPLAVIPPSDLDYLPPSGPTAKSDSPDSDRT